MVLSVGGGKKDLFNQSLALAVATIPIVLFGETESEGELSSDFTQNFTKGSSSWPRELSLL